MLGSLLTATILLSRRTFYRHRGELLKYGIDISVPSNVKTLPLRVRQVQVAALEAPIRLGEDKAIMVQCSASTRSPAVASDSRLG